MTSTYKLIVSMLLVLLAASTAWTTGKLPVEKEGELTWTGVTAVYCWQSDIYFVALKNKLVAPVTMLGCSNGTLDISYPSYVTTEMKQEIKEVLAPIIGGEYFD